MRSVQPGIRFLLSVCPSRASDVMPAFFFLVCLPGLETMYLYVGGMPASAMGSSVKPWKALGWGRALVTELVVTREQGPVSHLERFGERLFVSIRCFPSR